MKAVITCDDVFDALTREPFPSGRVDDEVVESHLAVCHECRRLAEAFRPAVGLFHESLSAGCEDELPMYLGRLKPIIEALPERSLSAPIKAGCSRGEQRHCRKLTIAASLVLVGAAVFATSFTLLHIGDSVPAAAMVRAPQGRDYTLLATLEIPGSCRAPIEYSDAVLTTEFVCCTKCHHASSRRASTNLAIGKTSAACAACHDTVLGEALSMVVPCNQFCETLLACATVQNL